MNQTRQDKNSLIEFLLPRERARRKAEHNGVQAIFFRWYLSSLFCHVLFLCYAKSIKPWTVHNTYLKTIEYESKYLLYTFYHSWNSVKVFSITTKHLTYYKTFLELSMPDCNFSFLPLFYLLCRRIKGQMAMLCTMSQ